MSYALCAATYVVQGLLKKKKGALGELGACTLLLVAHDFSAPLRELRHGRNPFFAYPLAFWIFSCTLSLATLSGQVRNQPEFTCIQPFIFILAIACVKSYALAWWPKDA